MIQKIQKLAHDVKCKADSTIKTWGMAFLVVIALKTRTRKYCAMKYIGM